MGCVIDTAFDKHINNTLMLTSGQAQLTSNI